jgi:uncharacterized protein with von Willebrand factor type A (vWA) domain
MGLLPPSLSYYTGDSMSNTPNSITNGMDADSVRQAFNDLLNQENATVEGIFQESTSSSPLPELGDTPIRVDRFDKAIAEEMREQSPIWQEVEGARKEEYRDFPEVMDTIFSALWKPYPERVPPEHLSSKGKALKEVLDIAEGLNEWKQLRNDTILDEVASAIGVGVIGQVVHLPDSSDGEEGSPGGEAPPEMSDDRKQEIRREIKAGIAKAQEEVDTQHAAEQFFWGRGDGTPGPKQSPEIRFKLAGMVKQDARIKLLLDLVGRFRFMAKQKHRKRVKHGRDELMDITHGSDLRDVLPQELLMLGDPLLEMLFFHSFYEESLTQYEYEAPEKLGRGPIVVRIDCSGSMAATLTGPTKMEGVSHITRFAWAVAVGLALVVIARKERRDLNIGVFNNTMIQEWTFYKGIITPDELFQIATLGVYGGTSFEAPLTSAMWVVGNSQFKNADIVFITDGECQISPEFLTQYMADKTSKGVTTYGIKVGSDNAYSNNVLENLCDEVLSVSNMTTGDAALNTVFSM